MSGEQRSAVVRRRRGANCTIVKPVRALSNGLPQFGRESIGFLYLACHQPLGIDGRAPAALRVDRLLRRFSRRVDPRSGRMFGRFAQHYFTQPQFSAVAHAPAPASVS